MAAEFPSLPPAAEVAHLAFLLGPWVGSGHGQYPTIEDFDYDEWVAFGHVGKPFLNYSQRTVNRANGLPAHGETGYLRPVGPDRVELVLAHSSGLVEVAEGFVELHEEGGLLEVASTTVVGTSTAKEVRAVQRRITVAGDVLRYELAMAAVGEPMTFHLSAALHRAGTP